LIVKIAHKIKAKNNYICNGLDDHATDSWQHHHFPNEKREKSAMIKVVKIS
jgi:hypothetical protein